MKFLYVIQSEKNYHDWEKYNNENRKIILGVWKDDVKDGQINLHGTTMPSGRNAMYDYIKSNKLDFQYDYITFCDDDVYFTMGSLDEYERVINETQDPLYHVTYDDDEDYNGWKWHTEQSKKSREKNVDVWYTDRIDTCMFSVRNDTLDKVFPFITVFDNQNWWVACELINIVAKNKDLLWSIISTVTVKNKFHREYPREENRFTYGHNKVVNYLNHYIGTGYKVYEYLVIEKNNI